MLDFKTPELEADLKVLKTLADTLEQASVWTYNAWTDAHNDLHEREENERFINLLGEVSKRVDALEDERKKLVAQIEARLKPQPPTPAKAVEAKPQGKANHYRAATASHLRAATPAYQYNQGDKRQCVHGMWDPYGLRCDVLD